MNRPFVMTLAAGRERSVLRRHPWIFSGSVRNMWGEPETGETVVVRSADGTGLGSAAWSPASRIRARMWTWDADVVVDHAFLKRRLDAAVDRRNSMAGTAESNACRLVSSEADGLPGLIVDRYDTVLVCQFLSAGAEFWREHFLDMLQERFPDALLYERSDSDAREKEGLPARCGVCRTEEPPELLHISEHGLRFPVDVRRGHKTGFYLCLLYTSPSPRDRTRSRMPSSA